MNISKSYPAILLTNKYRIPLYSIHESILPYCKCDVEYCGDFYGDEWSLNEGYGEDIKIEFGLYSQPLVKYLVSICIPEKYDK